MKSTYNKPLRKICDQLYGDVYKNVYRQLRHHIGRDLRFELRSQVWGQMQEKLVI